MNDRNIRFEVERDEHLSQFEKDLAAVHRSVGWLFVLVAVLLFLVFIASKHPAVIP